MQVVLGLGTNLGNREDNLARALDALERLEGTQLLKLSNLYETEPFDVVSQQDNYLNCCVLLETSLKPETLLEHCLEIEHSLAGCAPSITAPAPWTSMCCCARVSLLTPSSSPCPIPTSGSGPL